VGGGRARTPNPVQLPRASLVLNSRLDPFLRDKLFHAPKGFPPPRAPLRQI